MLWKLQFLSVISCITSNSHLLNVHLKLCYVSLLYVQCTVYRYRLFIIHLQILIFAPSLPRNNFYFCSLCLNVPLLRRKLKTFTILNPCSTSHTEAEHGSMKPSVCQRVIYLVRNKSPLRRGGGGVFQRGAIFLQGSGRGGQ